MNRQPTAAGLAERIAAALARRGPLLREPMRTAVRWLNGAGDGVPGLHVDALADDRAVELVVHVDEAVIGVASATVVAALLTAAAAAAQPPPRAIWWKPLRRDVRRAAKEQLLPEQVHGEAIASRDGPEFPVREGELRFLVRPREGYSHGLFLDQRDNRRQLQEWLARRTQPAVLNTFAYTCSFSVAAARAGARTTSVDLSARYLEWGRRNFAANGLDEAAHEFAKADALDWLEIAVKRGRRFDAIVLDPPTFSTSKQRGTFQVERDYATLAELALRVAAPAALLLCSHNQKTFHGAALAERLRAAARAAGRRIAQLEPFAPPPDFPGAPAENPAARGAWVTLAE